ncbi:hypothetical protein BRDID11004_19390 [Bradyrhizobium diazoefficiens]|uniref:AlgX/AlgJ SGNH hydrolase-like domain-containing protein n=1 Tax=Bradyrhizobium diazoefficiens TaxID=1355477 RepID=A0A810AVS2_9BRAD|nr:hypothetical protein [Bradyrhizobium diazoefficiens]BBZ97147.1 hypothetical protein F07S3_69800 [Bradyrhizobium diazoefficiens]BCA14833.1 hypothetical protein BDHF08_66800 [Bradyrhizobium diazoefficiens]BCE59246.1 hypothetical protein XF5B_67580 [Bradyrhizobium diazoefficiens]BCE67927.1 hypothetical protein XF6B_67260 [Bradyrhizobium diazoefficiens]
MKTKEILLGGTTVAIAVIGFLAVAECVLRFLPVAALPLVVPVTQTDPVFHYAPNRSFVYSKDWDLTMASYGRTNNDGWVNKLDYRKYDPLPLIGVIGDSFIEAISVPPDSTAQGHLSESLKGKFRVYSFAASGAPLSQYLVWAAYAVREYKAKALIINVVGNDYDESHLSYSPQVPGFWIYAPETNGELRLQLRELHVGAIRSLVKMSALARYLFLNLHVKETLSNAQWLRAFVAIDSPTIVYAGNTDASPDSARIEASVAAINAFFRDLPKYTGGLQPDRIIFTMDGFRYPDAANAGKGSYFDIMRTVFRKTAETLGYEVIDMDPLFFTDFQLHGVRFEYPRDAHWNPTAHALVAKAILSSRLIGRLQCNLGNSCEGGRSNGQASAEGRVPGGGQAGHNAAAREARPK